MFRCRLRNLAGNSGHVSVLQQFVTLVLLGFGLLLSLLILRGLLACGLAADAPDARNLNVTAVHRYIGATTRYR